MPQTGQFAALRAIDASLNRAIEGARVVEDYCRFGLDDAQLTQTTKAIRHELAALSERPALGNRTAARDTPGDVGTEISTQREAERPNLQALCRANLSRLQEALRSLEEFSKVLDPQAAPQFEALRYQSYTLAKALEVRNRASQQLRDAQLYLLVDGQSSETAFAQQVQQLCEAGIHLLQLRDKTLSDRQLLGRARQMVEIARPHGVLTIMNDRPDLARLAGTDGVHVGQEELSVRDARSIVGADAIVGVSTHGVEQLRQAVLDGADYVGLGPTFPSPTKSFDAFPGLAYLREAAAESTLPQFAIGGIDSNNLKEVLQTGIHRVAVASAVTGSQDPVATIRDFLKQLAKAPEIEPRSPAP